MIPSFVPRAVRSGACLRSTRLDLCFPSPTNGCDLPVCAQIFRQSTLLKSMAGLLKHDGGHLKTGSITVRFAESRSAARLVELKTFAMAASLRADAR